VSSNVRDPIERRVRGHDVELQLYEWPGEGPPVLLVHATSFHGRCWDAVAELLPGRQVYAIDMRGHGQSDRPPPPYDWDIFGLDLMSVVEGLGMTGAIGVGHSMGGHSVTAAAAKAPGAFSGLVLVDPVILPPRVAPLPRPAREHSSSRRRDRWASPGEMFESFAARPPFSLWEPRVLHDYCEFGLLPAPDGDGFTLACPPEIEVAVCGGAPGSPLEGVIEAITVPVRVLRARPRTEGEMMDMTASPTDPALASRFPNGADYLFPNLTHFIPMQEPGLVARHIEEMIAAGTGAGVPPLE
jgi:pimeloyl-ACP methyl ester carboxylesterase